MAVNQFELLRWPVIQGRVQSLPIVDVVDGAGDRPSRVSQIAILGGRDFDGAHKT